MVGEMRKAQHDKGHLSMEESFATPLEESQNEGNGRDGACNCGWIS